MLFRLLAHALLVVFSVIALPGFAVVTGLIRPDAYHSAANRSYCGISSIAVSPSGQRLWATWYASVTSDEDSNNFAILATSTDRGDTWKEVLIADPDGEGPLRAFDPQVWVAPTGKLCWIWTERIAPLRATAPKGVNGCSADPRGDRLMMLELDAETEPLLPCASPRQIGRGVMMGKPIIRKDGVWLFPSAWWQADPSACVLTSADNGQSYSFLGGASVPKKLRLFEEHCLLELADGRLRAYIRVNQGKTGTWFSESSDGGQTWGASKPCDFAHCSTRIFVRRLKSGAVLMVKNGPLDADVGRKQLTAYISDDDGATWLGGLVLSQGKATATYPDGDQAADGTIYLTWDADRSMLGDVHFARLTEAEIRAGKLTDPKSTIDGLIMKKTRGIPQPGRNGYIRLKGHKLIVKGHFDGLRAEFLDGNGDPLTGFTAAESIPVSGTGEFEMRWKENPDISRANGRIVIIRFSSGTPDEWHLVE